MRKVIRNQNIRKEKGKRERDRERKRKRRVNEHPSYELQEYPTRVQV